MGSLIEGRMGEFADYRLRIEVVDSGDMFVTGPYRTTSIGTSACGKSVNIFFFMDCYSKWIQSGAVIWRSRLNSAVSTFRNFNFMLGLTFLMYIVFRHAREIIVRVNYYTLAVPK